MPKIGRNDPCPCGSGKKYKQCHAPLEAAAATHQRMLRQAPDTALPKLLEAVGQFAPELPTAISQFWNGAYDVMTVQELDEHESRGSERFLTWFLFDYATDEGTIFERLLKDDTGLDLTELEREVVNGWREVRLQPYVVEAVTKGAGLTVRGVWDDIPLSVEDHAATKRLAEGDILIVHLLPVVDTYYITGAAAHLSADTLPQLHEFAALHLADLQTTQPDATYADLSHMRSYIFNHFVMALPSDAKEMSQLDTLVMTTKATLNVMGDALPFRRTDEDEAAVLVVPRDNG